MSEGPAEYGRRLAEESGKQIFPALESTLRNIDAVRAMSDDPPRVPTTGKPVLRVIDGGRA